VPTTLFVVPNKDECYTKEGCSKSSHEECIVCSAVWQKNLSDWSNVEQWKKSELCMITPVFKKGDRSQVNNYHPISLISPICKIMESIIKDSIQQHLQANNHTTTTACMGLLQEGLVQLNCYWLWMTRQKHWILATALISCISTSLKPLTLFHTTVWSLSSEAVEYLEISLSGLGIF